MRILSSFAAAALMLAGSIACAQTSPQPVPPAQSAAIGARVEAAQNRCDTGHDTGACIGLGLAYSGKGGIPADVDKAAALYAKACDGGNAHGCYLLGQAYKEGNGVDQDRAKAVSLFTQACNQDDAAGCDSMSEAPDKDTAIERKFVQIVAGVAHADFSRESNADYRAQLINLFAETCDQDIDECVRLVQTYADSFAARQFADKAITIRQKACNAGNAGQCNKLADIYEYSESGPNVSDNDKKTALSYRKKAIELYTSSCNNGKIMACYYLAKAYYSASNDAATYDHDDYDWDEQIGKPNLGQTFIQLSAKFFIKACDGGIADACSTLAYNYERGTGGVGVVDKAKAAAYRLKACRGGDSDGCDEMDMEGDNSQDEARALAIRIRACETGRPESCDYVGRSYLVGREGAVKDEAVGAAYMAKGCRGELNKHSLDNPCSFLAHLYAQGYGVAKSPEKYFEISDTYCRRGNGANCADEARAYREGFGVAQDKAKAVAYDRKACSQSGVWGCMTLAAALENGEGTAKNPDEAAEFYRRMCAFPGDKEACAAYKRLKGTLPDK